MDPWLKFSCQKFTPLYDHPKSPLVRPNHEIGCLRQCLSNGTKWLHFSMRLQFVTFWVRDFDSSMCLVVKNKCRI